MTLCGCAKLLFGCLRGRALERPSAAATTTQPVACESTFSLVIILSPTTPLKTSEWRSKLRSSRSKLRSSRISLTTAQRKLRLIRSKLRLIRSKLKSLSISPTTTQRKLRPSRSWGSVCQFWRHSFHLRQQTLAVLSLPTQWPARLLSAQQSRRVLSYSWKVCAAQDDVFIGSFSVLQWLSALNASVTSLLV